MSSHGPEPINTIRRARRRGHDTVHIPVMAGL
jgi:hypothetical protein